MLSYSFFRQLNQDLWLHQVYPSTSWKAREEISETLAEIFALSLAIGEAAEDWRVADVFI